MASKNMLKGSMDPILTPSMSRSTFDPSPEDSGCWSDYPVSPCPIQEPTEMDIPVESGKRSRKNVEVGLLSDRSQRCERTILFGRKDN